MVEDSLRHDSVINVSSRFKVKREKRERKYGDEWRQEEEEQEQLTGEVKLGGAEDMEEWQQFDGARGWLGSV